MQQGSDYMHNRDHEGLGLIGIIPSHALLPNKAAVMLALQLYLMLHSVQPHSRRIQLCASGINASFMH